MAKTDDYAGRLKQAMTRAGLDAKGGPLWNLIRAHAKAQRIPCPVKGRQTPYNWLNNTLPSPALNVFLADALGVSSKWLATGLGSPNKSVQPSDEEMEAIDILRALEADKRAFWLRQGHDLLDMAGKTTKGHPYRPKAMTKDRAKIA